MFMSTMFRLFTARHAIRQGLRIAMTFGIILSQGWASFSFIPNAAAEQIGAENPRRWSGEASLTGAIQIGPEAARSVAATVYGAFLPASDTPVSTTHSPLQSGSSGIRVYEQHDVNCANPQYPEVSLPYERKNNSGVIDKYLYVCIDGEGTLQLTLHTKALGYGPVSYTHLTLPTILLV